MVFGKLMLSSRTALFLMLSQIILICSPSKWLYSTLLGILYCKSEFRICKTECFFEDSIVSNDCLGNWYLIWYLLRGQRCFKRMSRKLVFDWVFASRTALFQTTVSCFKNSVVSSDCLGKLVFDCVFDSRTALFQTTVSCVEDSVVSNDCLWSWCSIVCLIEMVDMRTLRWVCDFLRGPSFSFC